MPVIYTILYLFFDEKRKTIKRKRRAKESPKMAVIVANLNIRKRSHRKNIIPIVLVINFLSTKKSNKIAAKDNNTEYLICDIKIEASLIVPESFLVGRISKLTRYTQTVLTKIPTKKEVIIIFHSLLEKLGPEPTMRGSRRSGNFILSTLSPTMVS